MRIGIFDPYLDDLGGGEKYMMTIAQILSEKNNVDVFWDKKEDLDKISARFMLNLSKVKLVNNIFSNKNPFFVRARESAKYDLIIFLSDGSLPLLFSKRTLIHFQQPFPSVTTKGGMDTLKKLRISSFFCNSKYTKSFIDEQFKIDSRVLYPPVEIKARDIKKENIILSVGRFRVKDSLMPDYVFDKNNIDDFKKFAVMTDVFKKMCKEGLSGWKFVMAVSVNKTEEGIFEKFRNTMEEFPIEFLINKSNSELWEAYSKSKIYWHAAGFGEDLRQHPQLAEHFGISTVEAMGAGLVPVVINQGGQREIVENNINGLTWNTLDELKEFTLSLIKDDSLLLRISQEAVKSARRFSKDNFENELNKLIYA